MPGEPFGGSRPTQEERLTVSRYQLRFRQVHLDFHTSPHIPGIGKAFDRQQWQQALTTGCIDSITCFSKCHHGWSYHPTDVGKMHPGLDFDLLRAQMDASREIGVNVPIYISVGVDDVAGGEHPEWREVGHDGRYQGWRASPLQAGFITMCFHTPYLDYLCQQIEEAVRLFPEASGVFLDIISQGPCCCRWCMEYMERNGLDAASAEDRAACAEAGLLRYYERATASSRSLNPDMPVFHNSGHVSKSRRELLRFFSHLELESLPTGGWGYDHFPMSAKFCQNLGLDFLGMTGKFHTTWGEFGGYKHPNALRYECAAMLAYGAKCSVGDQLHPSGEMDASTCEIIGQAYREVKEKEQFCDNVTPVAEIALLSSESENGDRGPDTGAGRALLEEHLLFDLVHRGVDFSGYRLLILPDNVAVDDDLKGKLDAFRDGGGKLLLTGKSGLRPDGSAFALDIGAQYHGESPFQPDYLEAGPDLCPSFTSHPLVMYLPSQQVRAAGGRALAGIRLPSFNRTWQHYCSHQHAPAAGVSDYAAAVLSDGLLYLAHPVFSLYHAQGAPAYREYIARALRLLLDGGPMLETNLPSTARVSLMKQGDERRYILHLLYGPSALRGASVTLSPEGYVRSSVPVEVIEDLPPLRDVRVSLKLPEKILRATLEPQGSGIPCELHDGRVSLDVAEFSCHQMIALAY